MVKVNKKWSQVEKLAILKEASEKGVQITLRKHGVYPGSYYAWKKKYEDSGDAGLDRQARTRMDTETIKKLEDENGLLKQLLAEKEMEVALMDELLKKKYRWACKKGKP